MVSFCFLIFSKTKKDISKMKMPFFRIMWSLSNTQQLFLVSYKLKKLDRLTVTCNGQIEGVHGKKPKVMISYQILLFCTRIFLRVLFHAPIQLLKIWFHSQGQCDSNEYTCNTLEIIEICILHIQAEKNEFNLHQLTS